MRELDYYERQFLHDCARHGPTDATSELGQALEKRGYVEYVYEGAALQGKWRLTNKGRAASHSESN